jgi:hypothetical protein
MAKYRALAQLYVGSRLVGAGESFTSDDVPGAQWEPLDDDGKERYGERHAKPETAKAVEKPATAKAAVDKKGG